MANGDDVDLAVSDKILESVATIKISLFGMASKAKEINRTVKVNSRVLRFNKTIYDAYLKFQTARAKIHGLNAPLPFKLGTSFLQAAQHKQSFFSGGITKALSPLGRVGKRLNLISNGEHMAAKPGVEKNSPTSRAGGVFKISLPKFYKEGLFFDQPPQSVVLQQRFANSGQLVSKPVSMKGNEAAFTFEVASKFAPNLVGKKTFLKTEMLNHMQANKAPEFFYRRGVHVKPLVLAAAGKPFVEQSETQSNQKHVPVGTRSADGFAADDHDGNLASSVVAALLAALTPALQASGRGVEPMKVVVINPEDIQQSTEKYLTAQAGVQTGPSGFDYALSLAHPAGVY